MRPQPRAVALPTLRPIPCQKMSKRNTMSEGGTPLSIGLALNISQRRSSSKAFILAVAALAGGSAAEPRPDVEGIPGSVLRALALAPKLDLRAKNPVTRPRCRPRADDVLRVENGTASHGPIEGLVRAAVTPATAALLPDSGSRDPISPTRRLRGTPSTEPHRPGERAPNEAAGRAHATQLYANGVSVTSFKLHLFHLPSSVTGER